MLEYVTIVGWLPLPQHVEVTIHYSIGSRRCVAYWSMPAGTPKTQHNEARVITLFKNAAKEEGYNHVTRKQRTVSPDGRPIRVSRGRT